MRLLIWLGVRFVIFGIALTFAMRKVKDVKVTPPSMLPVVALVFAVLNTALYWLLAPILNLVTLFALWFLVPFLANGLLLYFTDRIVKPFKIESLVAFVKTAGIVTIAHLLLRASEWVVKGVS